MRRNITPYFCNPKREKVLIITSESSSFGRARPCQGRGGQFEPGLSLQEKSPAIAGFFFGSPGGGIGRHAGLKILFAATRVTVQFRSGARFQAAQLCGFFVYYNNTTTNCHTWIIVNFSKEGGKKLKMRDFQVKTATIQIMAV